MTPLPFGAPGGDMQTTTTACLAEGAPPLTQLVDSSPKASSDGDRQSSYSDQDYLPSIVAAAQAAAAAAAHAAALNHVQVLPPPPPHQ